MHLEWWRGPKKEFKWQREAATGVAWGVLTLGGPLKTYSFDGLGLTPKGQGGRFVRAVTVAQHFWYT